MRRDGRERTGRDGRERTGREARLPYMHSMISYSKIDGENRKLVRVYSGTKRMYIALECHMFVTNFVLSVSEVTERITKIPLRSRTLYLYILHCLLLQCSKHFLHFITLC